MKRNLVGMLLCVLMLSIVGPSSSFACRNHPPTFEQCIKDADIIFSGRILTVKRIGSPEQYPLEVEIEFEVDRYWKGDVGKTAIVSADTDSCGFAKGGYRGIGERWLIFGTKTTRISTTGLSGNVWLKDKSGDTKGQGARAIRDIEKKLGKGQVP